MIVICTPHLRNRHDATPPGADFTGAPQSSEPNVTVQIPLIQLCPWLFVNGNKTRLGFSPLLIWHFTVLNRQETPNASDLCQKLRESLTFNSGCWAIYLIISFAEEYTVYTRIKHDIRPHNGHTMPFITLRSDATIDDNLYKYTYCTWIHTCHTTPYHTIACRAMPWKSTPCRAIPYRIIPYHTIRYIVLQYIAIHCIASHYITSHNMT